MPRPTTSAPAAFWLLLALVVLVGAGLRVQLFLEADGLLVSDSERHVQTAHNLSLGRWGVAETRPGAGVKVDRLYPVLYPALMALGSEHAAIGHWVSLLAGIAVVFLTGLLGLAARGPAAGLAAAFLTATCVDLIRFSNLVMTEALFSALLLLACLAFLLARRRGPWLLLASVALSLAFLTKPAALAVGLALSAALLLELRPSPWRRVLGTLAWFVIPFGLCVVGHALLKAEVVQECQMFRNEVLPFIHTLKLNHDPTAPALYSNDFSMTGYVLEHPARYAGYFLRSYSAGLAYLLATTPLPLVALGLAGGAFARRRAGRAFSPPERTLAIVVALFPLVPSLVIADVQFMFRMTVPVLPLVYVLACAGVCDLARHLAPSLTALRAAVERRPAVALGTLLALGLAGIQPFRWEHRRACTLPLRDDFRKPAWRAAAEWINDNVPEPVVHDDLGVDGVYLRSHMWRETVWLRGFGNLEALVEGPRPGPVHVLLGSQSHILLVERKRAGSPAWQRVHPVRRFGGADYSCLLLRIGE